MIKAFIGAIAAFLAATSVAAKPADVARRLRAGAEGTSSTPAVFALPQLGSAGFICGRDWTVQPFFNMGSAVATEEATIRAGAVARRNFAVRIVGPSRGKPLIEEKFSPAQQLELPFGHYRAVAFGVRQGGEAREIVATVRADVVAGTFKVRGVPEPLGACYVQRWSVTMNVSPY